MTPHGQGSLARTAEQIPIGAARLDGDLIVPAHPLGLILFAHGSGSSRHSPRNQHVAGVLQLAGLATLLVDLLTLEEERLDARSAHYRFDTTLLATRVTAIVEWLRAGERWSRLPIGLFGASTGAAAALVTAAWRPREIAAVVSRGGRPDLAGAWLRLIRAPTLLVVGSLDESVVELNRTAMAQMPGEVDLQIVPGATHLFEEPGTLDEVASLARDWFLRHLQPPAAGGR